MALALAALITSCALSMPPPLATALTAVESGHNPFAIGVVGGSLARQPRSLEEAIVTARALRDAGHNYSVGFAQVNQVNFARFGLTLETAFAPCANLRTGAAIYRECFERASRTPALRTAHYDLRHEAALHCYHSGQLYSPQSVNYAQKVLVRLR
jgi:type IV secretion system protein VirB1